jgi:CDP-diacylglycerol--glycerol-3-phosphate 3-phosphatidyltransferase
MNPISPSASQAPLAGQPSPLLAVAEPAAVDTTAVRRAAPADPRDAAPADPTAYRWLRWVTPNQLTYARIAAAPVLMLLIWLNQPIANYFGWVIFVVACLTDYWDGDLARSRKEVSQAGKLLDPLADKMLISATLVMLVARGSAGAVPTILILMREFAISGLRQVAAVEGTVIAAKRGGKAKTILQMIATGSLILDNPFGLPLAIFGQGMLWVAAGATVWTGYLYFAEYYRVRNAPR